MVSLVPATREITMSFGKFLKKKRLAGQWTKAEAARLFGISTQALSAWEDDQMVSGSRTTKLIRSASEVYEIPVRELWDRLMDGVK